MKELIYKIVSGVVIMVNVVGIFVVVGLIVVVSYDIIVCGIFNCLFLGVVEVV